MASARSVGHPEGGRDPNQADVDIVERVRQWSAHEGRNLAIPRLLHRLVLCRTGDVLFRVSVFIHASLSWEWRSHLTEAHDNVDDQAPPKTDVDRQIGIDAGHRKQDADQGDPPP